MMTMEKKDGLASWDPAVAHWERKSYVPYSYHPHHLSGGPSWDKKVNHFRSNANSEMGGCTPFYLPKNIISFFFFLIGYLNSTLVSFFNPRLDYGRIVIL